MAEILQIRRKTLSIQSINLLKNMYRRENDRWSIAHQQQIVMPLIIAKKKPLTHITCNNIIRTIKNDIC